MKKLIAFFLSASMLFTFASCTEKETDSKGNLTSVSEGQKNSGYTYKGDTFTISANSKWSHSEDDESSECTFKYKEKVNGKEIDTTVGVTVTDMPSDITFQELIDQTVASYTNSYEGCEVKTNEKTTLDGIDCYKLLISVNISDVSTYLLQMIAEKENKIYIINATVPTENYDSLIDDINEVIDSFKFV